MVKYFQRKKLQKNNLEILSFKPEKHKITSVVFHNMWAAYGDEIEKLRVSHKYIAIYILLNKNWTSLQNVYHWRRNGREIVTIKPVADSGCLRSWSKGHQLYAVGHQYAKWALEGHPRGHFIKFYLPSGRHNTDQTVLHIKFTFVLLVPQQ